jgi:hypothetical protein
MSTDTLVEVPHVVKGTLVTGHESDHGGFATPALDLNALVWPRNVPGPAFDVPVAEIMDVLEQVGSWLARDPEGLVEAALLSARRTSPLPAEVVDRSY